ncbi:hypothetical protein LSH36_390g02110 [Paralvinella palmiformis]|uniref:Cadherin domain-containing protein n=1 Tax=Paralvinella palmiformis TaxID=53620 RepID=A0AAD9JDT2_9ANNE|nr:hypothetical protein LSH36_390g02110 [Paralvinella palmiformis]
MKLRYHVTGFAFILLCQLFEGGRISPSIIIPSTARLGFVVTVLDLSEGQTAKLLQSDNSPLVSNTFNLHANGWLVTKRRLDELSGTQIAIIVRRRYPDGEQQVEKLTILVTNLPSAVMLGHQPYVGRIEENKESGSEIGGLEELQGDIGTLPYGCWLKLMDKDADLVFLDPHSGTLRNRIPFDRENRPFLYLALEARCGIRIQYAAIQIRIIDVNDNVPEMDDLFYSVSVSRDEIRDGSTLLRVHATDPDEDLVSYGMEEHEAFVVNRETGGIRIADKSRLLPKSYELTVFAVDEDGHLSEPSFVRIEVSDSGRSTFRRRHRRAVRPTKIFVVRLTQQGNLFTVAADNDNTANERFEFYSPDPDGLEIDRDTGMVSLIPGFVFNETIIDFRVNVTRDNEPGFEDDQPVDVYIVDRTWQDPVFTNQPEDMFVTIPEWIRPDTTIYTVRAIDSQDPYLAPVNYQIEAGDEGCFKVDTITGQVQVACRRQFVINKSYHLALSAQNVGAALTNTTPTQIVVTIECLSHQKVPITYELQYEDQVSLGVFTIDVNTGVVTLVVERQHIRDPHQYRMMVTATEMYTGYTSTTDLIINLDGENLHTPYFPGTVYPTETDISEDLSIDSTVVQGRLDYDRIALHRYDVTLTAVDMGTPAKSATTQLRIWMKDVPDEPPVLEPNVQTFRLNQDAVNDDSTQQDPYILDPNTGYLKLARPLKLDDATNLTIKATDNNGMFTSGNIIVEVIGVNHPPFFTRCDSYTSVILKEHEPLGTSVLNLTVEDKDVGVNGELTFDVYSSLPTLKLFRIGDVIKEGNGLWTVNLVSDQEIDRENPIHGWDYVNGELSYQVDEEYVLQVNWVASSGSGSPTEVKITIKENADDLPPIWNNFDGKPIDDVTGIKIMENETRGEIPSLNFTTNKASILETIPGATPYENGHNHFSRVTYGETSLVLTVIDDLDYETMKGISPDLPFTDARLRIDLTDVNDKTPQFVGTDDSRTYPAGVSDQTNPGDEVVKVTAIDGDGTAEHNTVSATDPEGDVSLVYSIEGTYVDQGFFSIEGNKIYKEKVLDRDYPDGHDRWTITVSAVDTNPVPEVLSGYGLIIVRPTDINDKVPWFDNCCLLGYVDEGAAKVEIPESDSGQKLFVVEPSGSIKTDVAGDQFNREITAQYRAVVFVRDPGGLQVDEQLEIGSRVGAVYATDNDTGVNSQLVFIITPPVSYFYIDSLHIAQAGVIRIAEILDYEDPSIPNSFDLIVSVTDGSNPSSTTSVTIVVSDVNDNAPVITPPSASVSADENKLNTDIQKYTATDSDTGSGKLSLDYETTDPGKKFWIDPVSGMVSIITELDWEKTSSYNIHILAIDKVNNLDDSPPFGVFDPPFPVVGGTTVVGDEVAKIVVTDTDSAIQDTTVEFNCNEPLCQDFTFSYTPSTDGYNRLDLGFDFYDLKFTFNDISGNSATQTVRIYIRISNSEVHTSGKSTIYVYNYKASLPDTNIGQVYCDDPEGWDFADKTFTPEQDYVDFNISSKDGTITMRRGAPRGEHILSIQVFDNIHQVSAVCSVNIFIFYVYDDAVEASGSIRIIGKY